MAREKWRGTWARWAGWTRSAICLVSCGWVAAGAARGAETNYLGDAVALWRSGKHTNALELISTGIRVMPKQSRMWAARAQMYEMQGRLEAAVSDFSEAIKLDPNVAFLYQERGELRFRLGRVDESVADFDRVIELRPDQLPGNWQRGIALYYAGRFKDGRLQFESHQTVNSNDVENAVWHFLCAAREMGIGEARKRLIPISGDTRVPMKEVHLLFSGKVKAEEVLAAAEKVGETAVSEERVRAEFYGHLYLALYYEALDRKADVWRHLSEAVKRSRSGGYMGDVARVHAARMAAAEKLQSSPVQKAEPEKKER